MNECNFPTDICLRFWKKVIIPQNYKNDCWLWTHGATDKDGYGIFHVATDWAVKAHRFAYQYYKGPIIPGNIVMHKCDNPPCCNPYHLKQGSLADNNTDRSKKGRSANPNAKLDEATVRQIKICFQKGYTNQKVATQFGIGTSNASRIRNNVIWSHVQI